MLVVIVLIIEINVAKHYYFCVIIQIIIARYKCSCLKMEINIVR